TNNPATTKSGCYARTFVAGDSRASGYTSDWDSGYYKGECGGSEYVAGISQDVNNGYAHHAYNILCCPANSHANHPTSEAGCTGVGGAATSNTWEDAASKLQCAAGTYAVGVSAVTSTGAPHKLLCCTPQ